MTFLKARWENLILVNYCIDPKLLTPYIPNGTELDLYNNKCYVSLVGFLFKDVKVLGLKIPGYINFEEVNLRFYVKRKVNKTWRRGVVFIKEIVPKSLITVIANTLYNEHYETRKMSHDWSITKEAQNIQYQWEVNNVTQCIKVQTKIKSSQILLDSEAEFITEHYFGYTKSTNKTHEYEVVHPRWNQFQVENFKIDVDFELNYGKDFSVLNKINPESILLADGSEVSVKNKRTMKF